MSNRTKLLWHSNAPWVPTGYGQQTSLFTPLLNKDYKVAVSSFYGLEGAPIRWGDVPIFPGVGGEYGNASLLPHAKHYFGQPRDGIVFTLMDVWVMDPDVCREMNMACWVPVDHEPAPPQVTNFFLQSNAIPIAMSKFGQSMLGRLDPLYVPHGIDTQTYAPMNRKLARGDAFPDDAFVVGMVAANKGRPSRKGFSQALQAFARFARTHDNVFLYLHTTLSPNISLGEDLSALIESLDVPKGCIRIADQYGLMFAPPDHRDMARVYGALDVLLNPSTGEGFGIPVIEAQSCGRPVIVTDATAMQETCSAGWKVACTPNWTPQNSWQFLPSVDDIVAALEDCYSLKQNERSKLEALARQHALAYDIHTVYKRYMRPAMRQIEQRFSASKPVFIPARKAAA